MGPLSRSTLSRRLRNLFLGGLVVVIPIVITVNALVWLFRMLDGLAQPLAEALLGRALPGIGFVITIGVVLLAGLLFSRGPLKRLLDSVEQLVEAIPVVGLVYGTTKKVISGIGGPGSENAFQRFVLARLPGRTTPGFLTGTFVLSRADGREHQVCTVYVPTNHLYVGDVVVLPIEDVIETDLSVEDGITLMLSAGASVPRVVRERTGGCAGRGRNVGRGPRRRTTGSARRLRPRSEPLAPRGEEAVRPPGGQADHEAEDGRQQRLRDAGGERALVDAPAEGDAGEGVDQADQRAEEPQHRRGRLDRREGVQPPVQDEARHGRTAPALGPAIRHEPVDDDEEQQGRVGSQHDQDHPRGDPHRRPCGKGVPAFGSWHVSSPPCRARRVGPRTPVEARRPADRWTPAGGTRVPKRLGSDLEP
jgi:uncharacterized membrane protein